MNRLLNAYYLPNYDSTVDEIAVIVGADCDGAERWLCVSINTGKLNPLSLTCAPSVFATQVVDSHECAEAWLESWRGQVSEVAYHHVVKHEAVFASIGEVKKLMESTLRVSSHDLLTKKIAAFCVSACAGDAPLTELTEITLDLEDLARKGPAAAALALKDSKSVLKMMTGGSGPHSKFDSIAERIVAQLDEEWSEEAQLAAQEEAQRVEREREEAELNEIVEEEVRRAVIPAWGLFH
ncbi:hypothetical protein ACV1DW_15745 [Aeromonas hydrophila]